MSNVRVAVRVRPLSKREVDQGAKIVVEVDGDNVRVTNLKVPSYQEHDNRARIRQFLFDFCYWSVDSNGRQYSSQEMIYEDLGSKVLDAVFEGFNACVLAYGQSGSGKTYTMMGCNGDLGLTPRICQGLFDRMMKAKDERLNFRTEVSFLEIYNERVGDLLCTTPTRKQRPSLRVREHPKLGPCVQDLSKHVVTDFRDVQTLIERGIQNRRVAATKLHDHSSRSHAIFTISFTQARLDEELPSEMVSKIHLVDLAGSERATVHTNKIRLKEGANINKSLVALGGVICALAEKSSTTSNTDSSSSIRTHSVSSNDSHRGHQTSFVPYRDSVLTWLLKDSLGGNSKTVMIAAVSPASTAYNETINTLRYTQRAKRIVNKPIINEDPNVRLIRELKAEIARLREKLSNAQMAGSLELSAEYSVPVTEIIIRNQDKAQELTRSWIEKWDYFKQHGGVMESCRGPFPGFRGTQPYMIGVTDTPRSSRVRIFYLKDVVETESEDDSKRLPDIILTGEKVVASAVNMKNGAAIAIQSSGASTCLQDNDSLVSSCPLPEMPLENPISEDVPCIEKSELSNKANRVVELTTEVPSNVNKNNSDNAPEYVKSTFDGYVDENHPSSDVDDVRNTEDAESGHHKAGLDDVVVDDVDWSDDDDFSYYNFENDVHQCSSPVKPVSVRRLSPIRECSGSACSTPLPSSEEHERGNHMYLGSKELCLLKSQDSVKDSGGQTTTDASTSPDSDSLDDKQCDDISYSDGVALLADKRTERQLGSAPFHAYLSLTGCRSDTSDCEREPDPLPVYSRHAGNRYKKRTRTALYSSSYNRNGAPNAANHRSSPKSGEVYSCSGNSSSEDESMSKTKGRPPKGGGLFEQILSENKRKRRKKTMVKRKSETLPYHYDHDSWVSSKTFIQDRSLLHKGTHKADLESPASPPPLPRPSVSMRSFSVQSGSPIIPEVSFQGRCEETEVKNNDHYHWSGRPSNSFWLSPPHEQDSGVRDEGSDVYEPTSENFRMSLSRPLLDNSFVADSLEELRDVNRCGNNNQDKQAAVGRNNETCARRRAFDTSQSWPSCDSLTMVYMGPEWGSTETNIVASLQSLEDQEKSDVNSERLVDSGTGGSASTGSQHSSNGSSCRTGKTFTICKNMISEVPVYKWQRADTTTLPWVKYHKYYKSNPWALRGYSSEDLGSDGEPYSWKQDQIRGPVVDGTCHLWNESPGSTWAEVSTQTGRTNDTDSGIQTDATLQSDSTQTMAPFCSVATQSVQCATDVACQTDPMMESRGTQTDPILATGESQTVTVTEMQPISNAVYTPSKPEYGESFTCFCCPSGQEKTTASSSSGNFQCHEVGFSDNKAEAAPTFSDTGALGFPKVSFTEGEDSRSVPVPRCESGIYIGFHGDISELLDFDFKISLRDGVLTKSKRRDDKDVEHKSSLRASQLQNSTEEPVMNSKPNSPDCKEHEEEEGDHWEDQSTRVCTPESNQQNEISENAKEELSPTFESPKSFLNKDKRFATSSSSCFCHSNTGIASFGNGTTFDQDQIFNSSSVSTTQRSSVPIHETHGSKVCKTSSSLVQFDVLSEFLDDKLRAFEKSMKQWMAPWCEKLEALEDTVSVGDKMILKDRHRDLKQPIRRDVIPKVNSKNLNPLVLPWDEEYRTLPVPNRTLKNGVTTQKLETSGGTFCQQPTKCTCSLRFVPEEANSPPSSEFTVDAELDEHLPEDVLQLLKECREVRKKAWNEITLAHGQLRMTTAVDTDPKCCIHGSKATILSSS